MNHEDRMQLEEMRAEMIQALERPARRESDGSLVFVSRERLDRWSREVRDVLNRNRRPNDSPIP